MTAYQDILQPVYIASHRIADTRPPIQILHRKIQC